MVRVEIVNVFLTTKGDEFIILLRGPDDERTLPISIGQLEAQSIAMKLYQVDFPRPLTHDLFKSVLEKTDSTVERVIIYDLLDSTFHAHLFLNHKGETVEVDSRPSDAIALAIRFDAPIFVEEKVLDDAGIILPSEMEADQERNKKEALGEPSTMETLKTQLEKAIGEERYEDAARIRDQITKIKKAN
ncbi:MAG: bifunctional nuclease family protein [Chitinispirillaceae bacterium]|nr:bifunctional nuclease family protein [Chitinispirillaceae bacterium]